MQLVELAGLLPGRPVLLMLEAVEVLEVLMGQVVPVEHQTAPSDLEEAVVVLYVSLVVPQLVRVLLVVVEAVRVGLERP